MTMEIPTEPRVHVREMTVTAVYLANMPLEEQLRANLLADLQGLAAANHVQFIKCQNNTLMVTAPPTPEGQRHSAAFLTELARDYPELKFQAGQSQGQVALMSPIKPGAEMDLAGHTVVEACRLAATLEAKQSLLIKDCNLPPSIQANQTQLKGIGELAYHRVDVEELVATVKDMTQERDQQRLTSPNVKVEQTQGTVLQADIKGFSGINMNLTAEQAGAFAYVIRESASQILERHGFNMSSWTGDGFVAFKEGQRPDPNALSNVTKDIQQNLVPKINQLMESWKKAEIVEFRLGAAHDSFKKVSAGNTVDISGEACTRAAKHEREATPSGLKADPALLVTQTQTKRASQSL